MSIYDKNEKRLFPKWDGIPIYIVAGIAIDVNISSSDDFSLSSEIIDEATEGLAVPTAYVASSIRGTVYLDRDKGPRTIWFFTASYGARSAVST
jgi:hypothetical protein